MPVRSLVSWGAMIDGYVVSGGFSEALSLFAECKSLQRFRVSKNHFSGKISSGVWGLPFAVVIDFGDNDFTGEVSSEIGLSISLTQLLSGIIPQNLQRLKLSSIDLSGNQLRGRIPSNLAMTGMVAEGMEIFKNMKATGIEPGIEHYGGRADIFGRAGRVQEAEENLFNMPMEPQASQLGALMAACRKHNKVELGERVGKHLISLEPHGGGRYVVLSSIYAAVGRWDDARSVRREMDHKGRAVVPLSRMESCMILLLGILPTLTAEMRLIWSNTFRQIMWKIRGLHVVMQ
ncbi:hypothetical protein IFM89_006222, partial [Coptis chinensis]